MDNVPIRMRVNYKGTRIDFATGYRIDADKWDDVRQQVKNGCTNKLKQSAADINTDLRQYEAEMRGIFKKFELAEVIPTKEQVKDAFNKMHISETAKEEAAKAEEKAKRKAKKQSNKKEETPVIQNQAASTTLGDIDALAALKQQLEGKK